LPVSQPPASVGDAARAQSAVRVSMRVITPPGNCFY